MYHRSVILAVAALAVAVPDKLVVLTFDDAVKSRLWFTHRTATVTPD